MGVAQVVLWDANCVKSSATATTDAAGVTTINTAGLPSGTYYLSVKYDPRTLVGSKPGATSDNVYTFTDTFATDKVGIEVKAK